MLTYPDIDPVAVRIGPLDIHWYGIMYLVAFAAFWVLGRRRARQGWRGWDASEVDDVLFYGALGAILGGRIGYALVYDFAHTLEQPLSVFRVWQGGMSFHGGLVGVLVAMWLFGRKTGKPFIAITDFVAPLVPPGLAAGRIGNFINGELWGRTTEVPWGMVFPHAGALPRHPSQLYQALLEGLALFLVLWWFSSAKRPRMAVSGLFLAGYGLARFAVEFVRLPDQQVGYLAWDWLTMGQVLTLPMIAAGGVMLWWACSHDTVVEQNAPADKRCANAKNRRRRRQRARRA